MSHPLFDRSPDLLKLRNEGYDLEILSGHLLVKDVPYLNGRREVRRGILVMPLTFAGDVTAQPADHVAHFAGEYPCKADGSELNHIRNASGEQKLAPDITVHHTFSAKPMPKGNYDNYYDKVTAYVSILTGPTWSIDPDLTAKTFATIQFDDASLSPFNYVDTASSRAEIVMITQKLIRQRIAIIGLGGTGSYVLDSVAKTPVAEIHLYDGDPFLQHNAFRSPGAASLADLREKMPKTTYFKKIYGNMHRGIVDHPVYVDAGNVGELRTMDFVFITMDSGPTKKLIIEALLSFCVPFVDTGMGLNQHDYALGGNIRLTAFTGKKNDHLAGKISFADPAGPDEYSQNIQIAELNALNAALVVIKWKKHLTFYRDYKHEHSTIYSIDTGLLENSDFP
jgi:ThiF family